MADSIAKMGAAAIVNSIESAPQRQALRTKDPRAWDEFIGVIRDLSPAGAEMSMRNVLLTRKPVTDLTEGIAALPMPVLVMVGDQDTPAFEASLFVHRHAPHAGLAVFPSQATPCRSRSPSFSTVWRMRSWPRSIVAAGAPGRRRPRWLAIFTS